MPITFSDRSNQWIDEWVELTKTQQLNHDKDSLFVPPHDEDITALVNDTLDEDEVEPKIIDFSSIGQAQSFSASPLQPSTTAVVAVDSGVIDLGELASGGTVFAIRGAAVCYPPNGQSPFVCRYNTGALVMDPKNVPPAFYYMGVRLGKPDLYVDEVDGPPYYKAKPGLADTSNQVQDRCRNFVERLIQEEAIAILEGFGGGVLLIDGALPAGGGTFDTPETYMRDLLTGCRYRNINVAAISKKTRITIGGRPISNLFAEQPEFVGYAPLMTLLEEERQGDSDNPVSGRKASALSVADEIYAVRFSFAPPALTFRADVHAATGFLPAEVLDQVYSHCQIYGGYPRPLIEAHQYSSFLFQDVQLLLADVTVRLGVRPLEQPTMEVLFQPFGGNRK